MEHLQLTSEEQHALQRVRDELSDCALYSGVAVVCEYFHSLHYWEYSVKQELSSKLNFKPINFDRDTQQSLDYKILLSTVAQSQAYPKPQAAGSPPFVVAIFVSVGVRDSADSLHTRYGAVHIVDDIIKLFLPQSAPHLQHIPKLFFVACFKRVLAEPESQPLLFPTDPDANYRVAYYAGYDDRSQREWAGYITRHLSSSMPVQDIIENSRSLFDKEHKCLHSFSCLKHKLVPQS